MRVMYGKAIDDRWMAGEEDQNAVFNVWASMIRRCIAPEYMARNPSYSDVKIAAEWLRFSGFYWWAIDQDRKGKRLDKDLLSPGSLRKYSPDTCVFLSQQLNSFLVDGGALGLPSGVIITPRKTFKPMVHTSPLTKRKESVSEFDCPQLAHAEWKAQKHKIALEYASIESNQRVKSALELRYAN